MLNLEGIIQMTKIRTLLFTSLAVAASFAAVQAQTATDVSGAWKLAVGANEACPLTLVPDGTVSFTSDCAKESRVAHWRVSADKLELKTASGETVGLLRAQDGRYVGKRFADGRALLLSR
jgi:hypothetical protein